jgi:hypothetical protein
MTRLTFPPLEGLSLAHLSEWRNNVAPAPLHFELDQLTPLCPSNSHSAGTSTGAPLSLIKNTRNLAGLVLLAFRPTT